MRVVKVYDVFLTNLAIQLIELNNMNNYGIKRVEDKQTTFLLTNLQLRPSKIKDFENLY